MDEHNEENFGDLGFLECLLKAVIVKNSVNDASAEARTSNCGQKEANSI